MDVNLATDRKVESITDQNLPSGPTNLDFLSARDHATFAAHNEIVHRSVAQLVSYERYLQDQQIIVSFALPLPENLGQNPNVICGDADGTKYTLHWGCLPEQKNSRLYFKKIERRLVGSLFQDIVTKVQPVTEADYVSRVFFRAWLPAFNQKLREYLDDVHTDLETPV